MSSISIGQITKPQDWISRRTAGYVARISAKVWSEHRSVLVLSCESILAVVSFLAAVFVVSETQEHGWATAAIRTTLVFLVSFRVVALLSAKLYRRSLRYACIPDIISIAKIAFLSSLSFWTFVWWQFPELRLPAAGSSYSTGCSCKPCGADSISQCVFSGRNKQFSTRVRKRV